jgi:hypothetical protein
MLIAALSIAVVGLIVAILAYCRASSGLDARSATQRLRDDVQQLTARHRELVESAAQLLDDAYGRTRQNIVSARETLRQLKIHTAAGLERRAMLAAEELEGLNTRLEESMRDLRVSTVGTARRAHETIARRVSHLRARTLLLLAEAKARRARDDVMLQRFVEAEECLDEAMDLMRRAMDDLGTEAHFEVSVENIRRASREAIVSLRAHAHLTAVKMDRLLAENGRLIDQLEREGSEAAGHVPSNAARPNDGTKAETCTTS